MTMRKIHFASSTIPLALLILCLLSFGLMIPWLGFYWDDWPSVWFNHLGGASVFKDAFASDRPLLGWLFTLTMPWLGDSPLNWQLFGLATRWLTSLALWWLLNLLWPERSKEVAYVTFIFTIYPGFQQQWIAVTYSHVLLTYAAFLFSHGLMILAYHRRGKWQWLLTMLALALCALVMFCHEYFFGLELIRPVLLWLVFTNTDGKRNRSSISQLLRVFLYWLPYLAIMAAFILWRTTLHEFPRAQLTLFTNLRDDLPGTLSLLGLTVVQDITEAGILSWGLIIQSLFSATASIKGRLISLAISLIVAMAVSFYLGHLNQGSSDSISSERAVNQPNNHWALHLVGMGILALFLAGWPNWVTSLPIRLDFPWDRFTLSMMLGASLLFVGILELLIQRQSSRILLIGLIIGLAAGFHTQNANNYRKEWELQKDLFWQLTWRAPAITPKTTLITERLPFTYYTDNSLTAPLNWTYSPENHLREMDYFLYDIQVHRQSFPLFEPNQPIERPYRATTFSGNTSQVLVFLYAPPGCLRFLQEEIDMQVPKYPASIYDALPLTNLNLILPSPKRPATPPHQIFGTEPPHQWCYFFEKADLARQAQDWEKVLEIGAQAFQKNYQPRDLIEYFPFIEANARLGYFDEARSLTDKVSLEKPKLRPALCTLWHSIENSQINPEADKKAIIDEIYQSLGCRP